LEVILSLKEDAAKQSDYIQNRVSFWCREQSLSEAILKSVEDIQGGKMELVLPRIQQAMTVGVDSFGQGLYLLKDSDKGGTVEEARSPIPSGISYIDGPLKGGLGRRELGIVMAGPNIGKTTALINMGTGILKNRHKVFHASCEMDEKIVMSKYDQCLLRKSDRELNIDDDGKRKLHKFLKGMREALKSDIYIKSFPSGRLTLETLKAHILMLQSRDDFHPDVILVDYMDIMQMPSHIKEPIDQLTWIGVELRAMAWELNVAIWTATQTNRGAVDKELASEADVAGDFKKMATADVVVSINQTKKEAVLDEARWFYVKNRIGKKYTTHGILTDFERTLMQPNV
jgi:replicative DNA helicase